MIAKTILKSLAIFVLAPLLSRETLAQCGDPQSKKCISALGVRDIDFGEYDFSSEKLAIEGICIYSQLLEDRTASIRNSGGSTRHSVHNLYFSVQSDSGEEIPMSVAIRSGMDGTWRAVAASDGYREIVFDVAEYATGHPDCSLTGDTHFLRTIISQDSMEGASAGVYRGIVELDISPN
jgi:hypothetical protein